MVKLRISPSLINYWNRNRTEDLINYYFKLKEIDATEPMIIGRGYDELNNISIRQEKKMIPEFGGIKLNNPAAQVKLEVVYKDFELVGQIDVLDPPSLYELKIGKFSALDHLDEIQVPFYLFLCELKKIEVNKAILIRYDPETNKTDWAMMLKSNELLKEVEKEIIEKGNLIYEFFKSQGLL